MRVSIVNNHFDRGRQMFTWSLIKKWLIPKTIIYALLACLCIANSFVRSNELKYVGCEKRKHRIMLITGIFSALACITHLYIVKNRARYTVR